MVPNSSMLRQYHPRNRIPPIRLRIGPRHTPISMQATRSLASTRCQPANAARRDQGVAQVGGGAISSASPAQFPHRAARRQKGTRTLWVACAKTEVDAARSRPQPMKDHSCPFTALVPSRCFVCTWSDRTLWLHMPPSTPRMLHLQSTVGALG